MKITLTNGCTGTLINKDDNVANVRIDADSNQPGGLQQVLVADVVELQKKTYPVKISKTYPVKILPSIIK